MIATNADCPAGVPLLADHLDTILAAGEDVLALELPARADLDVSDPEGAPEALDAFVRRLSELESALLARILLAHRRAAELRVEDAIMGSALRLFRAQTDIVHDTIEALRTREWRSIDGGSDGLAFLRTRGLLAPEAAAPSPYETTSASEDFRIGGAVRLGDVMDLTASLLDLLDARFALYATEDEDADKHLVTPSADNDDDAAPVTGGEAAVATAASAVADDQVATDEQPVLPEPAQADAGDDDGTAVAVADGPTTSSPLAPAAEDATANATSAGSTASPQSPRPPLDAATGAAP